MIILILRKSIDKTIAVDYTIANENDVMKNNNFRSNPVAFRHAHGLFFCMLYLTKTTGMNLELEN